MQDVTVANYRVQEYRLHSPPSIKVMYCMRVSLRTVAMLKRRESWVISTHLCLNCKHVAYCILGQAYGHFSLCRQDSTMLNPPSPPPSPAVIPTRSCVKTLIMHMNHSPCRGGVEQRTQVGTVHRVQTCQSCSTIDKHT
jgi:hypothetical protein